MLSYNHNFIAFPGLHMEAALWGARAKWFELGLALNLSKETLEVIFLVKFICIQFGTGSYVVNFIVSFILLLCV